MTDDKVNFLFASNRKELRIALKRKIEEMIETLSGGDWMPDGTLTLPYEEVETICEEVAEWADEWIFSLFNKANDQALKKKLSKIREQLKELRRK